MCGISGIVAAEVKRFEQNIHEMTSTLSHRGPDGQGVYFFQNCGLGHRRLSIIDLSTGQQPMLSHSKVCAITFNGEIYGYQEIRRNCWNYPFMTTSDTEVILALYELYGNNFIRNLPGMFAFALWDEREQALICARDRFGEKPFFYAFGTNDEFIFGSEIKSILASGLIEPVLDKESVSFYLQNAYIHPHKTIYKNIYSLPPAHSLTLKDGQIKIDRYWELPQLREEIGLRDAVIIFKNLLDSAITKQLIADVPVGAFLSGGLDSSTIVAMASYHQPRIMTFSFGFQNGVSELPYAREVANRYDTDHFELFDNTTDVGNLLVRMQQVYDEPFADTSNIPTYLISKLASDYVKVVLTGDGGDELFAGYTNWYRPLLNMENMHRGKWLFYKLIRRVLQLSNKMNSYLTPSLSKAMLTIELKEKYSSIASAHFYSRQNFTIEELANLGLKPHEEHCSLINKYCSNTIDDALKMDVENWMAGDILVKIDRASMAHGLELRAPFLDVDFASFCISLPSRLKITNEKDKYILREACSSYWPESIRIRSKSGFGAPFHDWFKRDSVQTLIHEFLIRPQRKIFKVLNYQNCRPFIAKEDIQMWTLLVLSIWMESHHFTVLD